MPQQAQSGQQQYLFHPAGNGNMLMIDDPEDQSPRGAMEREADENGFTLHGRLDLESLGRLHFALRKLGELPLQIDLRAADHATFVELQQPFSEWLAGQRQQEKGSELNGYLSEGSTPIVQPKRSAGTTA